MKKIGKAVGVGFLAALAVAVTVEAAYGLDPPSWTSAAGLVIGVVVGVRYYRRANR
jgi:predicted lysophospholipase L1 biosynthesis ABC-type transport system permease subunit